MINVQEELIKFCKERLVRGYLPNRVSEHTLKALEANQFGNIIGMEKYMWNRLGYPEIELTICENLIFDNYFVQLNEKRVNNLINVTGKTVDPYEGN